MPGPWQRVRGRRPGGAAAPGEHGCVPSAPRCVRAAASVIARGVSPVVPHRPRSCPSFLIARGVVPGRSGVPDGNGRTWSNRTTRYARSHSPSRPSWEGTGVLHRASGREARPQSAPPPRSRGGAGHAPAWNDHSPSSVRVRPRGRLRSDHVASPVRSSGSDRLVRVGPNAFVEGVRWDGAGPRQRYVTRVYARLGRLGTPAVASHVSAAAVHGLPALSGWNAPVHATVPESMYRGRTPTLVLHTRPVPPDERVEADGVAVTSVPRTVVDIAMSDDLRTAVVVADAPSAGHRHRVPPAAVHHRSRGRRRADQVIDLADGGPAPQRSRSPASSS